jgi:hypothetical protein
LSEGFFRKLSQLTGKFRPVLLASVFSSLPGILIGLSVFKMASFWLQAFSHLVDSTKQCEELIEMIRLMFFLALLLQCVKSDVYHLSLWTLFFIQCNLLLSFSSLCPTMASLRKGLDGFSRNLMLGTFTKICRENSNFFYSCENKLSGIFFTLRRKDVL